MVAGRFLDDSSYDEQRAALLGRLGSGGLDALLDAVDYGVTLDGRARPVVSLPKLAAPSARDVYGTSLHEVDDHLASPDELLASEDARKADRIARDRGDADEGSPFAGLEECARGTRVPGPKRNVDRRPMRKPRAGGKTGEDLHAALLRPEPRDARTSRPRPALIAGRVSDVAQQALYDDALSAGEMLESLAATMVRTGRSAADVLQVLDGIEDACPES